jgi:hypothetical protein
MDFEKFNKFGSLLLKDEFVLSYSGYASEDVLHSMGETLRQRLADHTEDKGKIKHVFSVFVELMQNLIRYGAEGPHPTPKTESRQAFGLIMVIQNGPSIEVMSGNYVLKDEANDLVNRVNKLNDKSADQLRALYREKLRQPPHEGSKGASIGLVEVARRASAPLSCTVEDTNQGYSFFMIKARI